MLNQLALDQNNYQSATHKHTCARTHSHHAHIYMHAHTRTRTVRNGVTGKMSLQ